MTSAIKPDGPGAPRRDPRKNGPILSRLRPLLASAARSLAGVSAKAASIVTNLTDSTRATYAAVAALAMAIVLTAGLIASNLHEEALTTAEHDNRRLATVLAAQTERLLQAVDVVLKDIARDAGLERVSTPEQFRTAIGTRVWHDAFVSRLSGLPQAAWLSAVDADGNLTNTSLSWPLPSFTVADRPYFAAMRRDGAPELGISEPTVSRANGSRMMLVMRRISAPDGRFLGLLTATVQLAYIDACYAALGLPPGMRIVLVRHDGLILTSFPSVEQLREPAIPPGSNWHRTVAEGGGEYWGDGVLDGEVRLVSTRPVNGFPVVVNVGLTRTAMFAAWWNKLAGIGLIILFALAGLAGLLRVVLVQYAKLRIANDVLEKSERRFRTLTATAQDAIITVNESGAIHQWNNAAERILGYSQQEAAGRQVHELLVPPNARYQSHQCIGDSFSAAKAKQLGKTVELTALRKDGTEIDIELSLARARIGTAWESIGILRDVTQRKQAEKALKAARDELAELASFNRHIIEQAPFGILLYQQNGQCILANPAAADIVGTSPDVLMTQNFRELEPWRVSGLMDRAHSALDENRMVNYDHHHWSSFGKEVEIDCRFVPFLRNGAHHLLLIVDDITERKFLETEIRRRNQLLVEREADLRSILDNMPSMIGYWDRSLCNRFANHAYEAWFGLDPDCIPGRHISDVIGEERYRLNLPYLTAALSGEAQEFERAIPCPDGSFIRHALVRYIPDVRDGEVHGIYALVFDVTTLKDTEAALRAARDEMADLAAFNERIIRDAPIAIALYLADGQCVLANPAAARMAGTTQQTMLAQNFRELEPWRQSGMLDAALAALAENQMQEVEFRYVSLSGKEIWGHARLVSVLVNGVRHLMLVAEDLTERKSLENALEKSKRDLQAILNNVPSPISYIDKRQIFRFANRSHGIWFRINSDRVAGMAVREVFGEELYRFSIPYLESALNGYIQTFECVIPGYDGDQGRYAIVNFVPDIEAGGVRGVYVLAADISVMKQAREVMRAAKEAAERADRAKSSFLATMSHEIRTPINGVIGLSELLLGTSLDAAQHLWVDRLQASANHLLRIVDDILDFSRLEADQVQFDSIPFHPATVAEQSIHMLQASADTKGLRWQLALPEAKLPMLLGDPSRLRQVLLNLLGNALKFTEKGGVILTVRPSPEDHDPGASAEVEFVVQDTGIGIPEAALPRLFAQFSQVDGSIARRFGGSGLGLAICQRLVARMGGKIVVESREGEGSCFHFRIRLPKAAAAVEAPTVMPVQAGGVRRVLVAEDDPIGQIVIVGMLQRLGHTVEVAGNGVAAVAAAREGGFDAILMDMMMPEMNGLEATRAIRALDGPASRVRIIALTANALPEDAQRCREAGMDDVLTKPARLEVLEGKLGRAAASNGAGAPVPADAAGLSANPSLFDPETYCQLYSDGDPEGAAWLMDYLDLANDLNGELQMLLAIAPDAATEREAVVAAAHRLVGSSLTVGASRLAEAARTLERDAAREDLRTLQARHAALAAELAAAKVAIVNFLSECPSGKFMCDIRTLAVDHNAPNRAPGQRQAIQLNSR